MRRAGSVLILVLIAIVALREPLRLVTSASATSPARSGDARNQTATAEDVRVPVAGRTTVEPGRRMLLVPAEPANAAQITAALPAPTRAMNYVRVDRKLIEGKSSPFWAKAVAARLQLPLPDGRIVTVVIDDSQMLGANRFTSSGSVEGDPDSRAVFAYNEGFLTATIETANHSYALRPATDDFSQWYEVDPALVPPCGGVRRPPVDAAVLAAAQARRARQAEIAATTPSADLPTAAATDPAPVAEVHLMMAYTQAVKPTMTGAARVAALQSEFDAATAKVNNELAASQVRVRVKLVRIVETQYDETRSASDKVQDEALTAIAETNDGKMDDIHARRDEAGADVVCLALARADASNTIGLSYVLATPSVVSPAAAAVNPLYAFAVVQYATIAGTDVVPHELGHIFGCAHAHGDPGTTGTGDGAYSYSYGYRFKGRDGQEYHDIMAYSPGTALRYYSNPRLVVSDVIGVPIGSPAGTPTESDCAQTIEHTAFEVASYRLQTAAAPAGTLVNVSTRAYVGRDDQVLIAGFVIDGAQPKRVLVRAAGPALANYGVSNALSSPRLRLFSGANLVAQNSGWSVQPDAAAVADATARVGAFAFGSGSADSATLVTLEPGSYSAVVDDAGGLSGSGLVEVYDVDRTGNRIVNLSTRGFADKGREMFGGFVVQGAAGTTKRILIRVLGPTLGRSYGVKGAMDDPMLELHNASGDLLIKDDDWSSDDTTATITPENDFSPAIQTYSEQQIAATGFAPSNRREPCVMLDLPPGSYSVIAQPFEDLSGTTPQTAAAGVAIVEVYEIAK